jgi:hypothetical protein
MNTRGAKLVSVPAFEASLQRCAADVVPFEDDRLEGETLDGAAVAERLWSLIEKLRITATSVRLVACTKALHHLLPNLVVPMDRQFTGAFFGWNTYDWQVKEERLFKSAFAVFHEIARKTNGVSTSVPAGTRALPRLSITPSWGTAARPSSTLPATTKQ